MALAEAERALLRDLERIMVQPRDIAKVSDDRLGEMVTALATMVCGMVHQLNQRRARRRGH